jgi:hypothetical protein
MAARTAAGLATALLAFGGPRAVTAQAPASAAEFTPLRVAATVVPALATRVDVNADSLPLARVLQNIARDAKLAFAYDRALPGLAAHVTLHERGIRAGDALLRALEGSPLDAVVSRRGNVVLVRRPRRATAPALRGIVVADNGLPVAGARVELSGTRFETRSAEDGSFVLARGTDSARAVRVTRIGFRPTAADGAAAQDGSDGSGGFMVIVLEPAPVALEAVVVSPGYFGLLAETPDAPRTLGREEIRSRPQLGDDLFRSINRLPGLSSNDFAAGFHARGAEVDQLLVSLDGVQLYEPFHLKDLDGALSILDVQAMEGVELTTGGFTAENGGRLGSLLAIRSLAPRTDRVTTSLALSITSLRLQSQGGFANGRASWLVSARRGYLDLALKLAHSGDSVSPRYSDVFAKTSFDINARNRVTAHLLRADDGLSFKFNQGPINSGYASTYGWLTWESHPRDGLQVSTVASRSALSWLRDGVPELDAFTPNSLHDQRTFSATSVRQDWTLALGSRAVLKWGAELQRQDAGYDYDGTQAEPVVHGDTLTEVITHRIARLAPGGTFTSGWISPRLQPASWLVTELGLRYERSSLTREGLLAPRANVRIALGRSTTLRAALGRYAQPQAAFELQASDGVQQFAPADLAEHHIVGLERQLDDATMVRVEAYERVMMRERPRYINLRTRTHVFAETDVDRLLLDATEGRAQGVELMARHRSGAGLDWSASYSLASVTDRVQGRNVPRTYDQRHTAYFDASYHPAGSSWRFNVAWQVHSGWPEAPVTFAIDTVRTTNGGSTINVLTTFGPVSALGDRRLPWYQRTDLRVSRFVELAHGRLSFFADVFNVFNATNPRSYSYNYAVRAGRVSIQRVPNQQIGTLPSAGISWEF